MNDDLTVGQMSNAQLADAMAAGSALTAVYDSLAAQFKAQADAIITDLNEISIEIAKRVASGLN